MILRLLCPSGRRVYGGSAETGLITRGRKLRGTWVTKYYWEPRDLPGSLRDGKFNACGVGGELEQPYLAEAKRELAMLLAETEYRREQRGIGLARRASDTDRIIQAACMVHLQWLWDNCRKDPGAAIDHVRNFRWVANRYGVYGRPPSDTLSRGARS